jgi:hypothetical protein
VCDDGGFSLVVGPDGLRRATALQINIAREGGKRVNVQGDMMNGQRATPALKPATGNA